MGFVLWLTGLPGSGKSTLAKLIGERLRFENAETEELDGDEVRKWLSPSEGYSREDRERHLKRVAHVAALLSKHKVAVIASFVSPYKSSRDYARSVIPGFVEVYVKCSVETCKKRDPKGLYGKASAGKISNMTGVQDEYESPLNPEITVDTEHSIPQECVAEIFSRLKAFGYHHGPSSAAGRSRG